jgi:dCMP deaminase
MLVAAQIAKRSKCDGRQIGAVIVSEDNAYSVVGYNGPPAGYRVYPGTTCKTWCPRLQTGIKTAMYDNCISIHAEANALMRADHSRIQGGTLFVTSACCWDCGKLVANSGVKNVIMILGPEDGHREPGRTIQFLRDSQLFVEVIDVSADSVDGRADSEASGSTGGSPPD